MYNKSLSQSLGSLLETQFILGSQRDTTELKRLLQLSDDIKTDHPDSSKKILDAVLEDYKQLNYPTGVINTLQALARYHADDGNYEQSLNKLQEALSHCRKHPETQSSLPLIYGGIATLYQLQNNYRNAAHFYFRSIMEAQRFPESTGLDYTYSNLAGIFNIFGQTDIALSYLKRAEQIALEKNHTTILENVLANRGIIYITQEKWDLAMEHFQNTLYLGEKYNLPRAQHFALINMAAIHLQNNEAEKALEKAQKALVITTDVNTAYLNNARIILGNILYQLRRFQEAEDTLLHTLATAEKLNIGTHMARSHEALAKVYAATGRYRQAYLAHQKYMALQDSIKSREIAHTVNQLEMKFRVAEKDNELYRQQLLIYQQQRRIDRKNLLIISTTTGAIALMILLAALYRNRRHKQQIVQLKAMMKGEEKERNRIGRELHDGIGGMLTAVNMNLGAIQKKHQNLPEMKEFDAVIKMLQDTAAEIRKTSHNLMPDILLRHGFPETLRMYCDQINKGSNTQIDLQSYGDLDDLDSSLAFSLYRILQELIQNIVKHAEAKTAVIQIRQYEERLTIIVEDDGIGFQTLPNNEGAGLQNIRSRVKALQGHISIESAAARGTTVYIEFDLEKINSLQ